MSGAGFDALVMNDTNEEIKAKFGWVAYVQSGMKHMLGRSHPVRISVDGGEPRTLPMRSVLIANCGRLQGGIRLADMTDVNDGNLEVIVASPRDWWSGAADGEGYAPHDFWVRRALSCR